ncbi:MAG: hypothetical protein IPG87_17860, partial [Saprospiraceae bacterium]|nr:hypothetical protein [Candidatus Vicinibacter affinis]
MIFEKVVSIESFVVSNSTKLFCLVFLQKDYRLCVSVFEMGSPVMAASSTLVSPEIILFRQGVSFHLVYLNDCSDWKFYQLKIIRAFTNAVLVLCS